MIIPLPMSGPKLVPVLETYAVSETEFASAVAVDREDNVIVVGRANSNDFPTKDAYDDTLNGEDDIFVSKFSSSGELLWSTFLGGTNWDSGYKVTVDHADNIVIIGSTSSSDFPIKNADNIPSSTEVIGSFVCKFSSAGNLLWSIILRGILPRDARFTSVDSGAVDSTDNIILVGIDDGRSSDQHSWQTPNSSVVVLKISSNGTLVWRTSFGGSDDDDGYDWGFGMGLAVDSADNVVLVGQTESEDFPIQGEAYDSTYNGGRYDVFVCKLSVNGDLLWSTFLGGNDTDNAEGLAVDSTNNVVLVGSTRSENFPGQNTSSHSPGHSRDGFVCKLSSQGHLLWSAILGGTEGSYGQKITVDDADNIVFGGHTYSWDFPTTIGAYDNTYNGESDGFVGKLSSRGIPQWSTFFGGNDRDYVNDIAVDSAENVVLVGETSSEDFPTRNAYDSTLGGYEDAVVCKFASNGSLLWSTFLGGGTRESFWDDVIVIGGVIGGGFIVVWLAILFVILRKKPKELPQKYSVSENLSNYF